MTRTDDVNDLSAERRKTTGGRGRPGKRDVEAIYPLSPTQQGLLFHTLVDPGAYYQRISCELSGSLDVDQFEGAWQDVLQRHPVLRTAFAWEGLDEPVQLVGKGVRLPFCYEDWRGASPAEARERVAAFLDEDQRQGFAPRRAPLFRVALLHLDDERFHFVWSHHHLILDGWSASRVLAEVFHCYRGRVSGEPARLAPARPFRDFIAWLRRRDSEAAEAFWRERLGSIRAPTPLPAARPTGAGEEAGSGRSRRALPAAVGDALEHLARSHGLTLNTVVQGLWALLLSRHGGTSTVVFGSTSSGRPVELDGAEAMVGMFISTFPVRVDAPGDDDALRWLSRLQGELAELGEHEHVPLVDIHRWSGVPAGTPLFETLVVFENYPVAEVVGESGWDFEVRDVQTIDRAHYPLTLDVSPRPTFSLDLGYDLRRCDPVAAERLLGHFATLAGAIAADPQRPLGALPMLTDAERQTLLESNDTAADLPLDRRVHELFEEQVARWPDRAAATMGSRHVTYGELDGLSARAAAGLAAAGVGRGTVVALLADRSPEFLAVLLGIFRAGGAYLPLDPHHPPARLARVLERSGAPVAIVGNSCRELVPAVVGQRASVLFLEELLRYRSGAREDAELRRDDLAYVLYTSGSTGVPKGAMVEHRGMLNHLQAKLRDLDLGPLDVVAQNASQSFDISVWQLLAPVASGGTVRIFDAETSHDPLRLLAEVERCRVTVLETVPSLLGAVLDTEVLEPGPGPPALRWLIATGEALPPDLCRRWLELFPEVPLLNAYGPTECSDDVTHHSIEGPPEPGSLSVPIGRAIVNTRLYVLDAAGRLVPVEVPGELWVTGTAVGRGYLHDPGRTAGAFVPDPFAETPGARAYRTGDLVRRSPDGTLTFLGRLDHQVKVRGFRIELGEIESLLRTHPAIAEAAVHAWDDASAGPRLVAYAVAAGEAPEVEDLRRHLFESLPEYMVPAGFVFLDRLPLNDNGKLDRAALPAPDPESVRDHEHVPPRTETEKTLAALWAEVLGRDSIGVHDDFFALGGHSLTATQLVSRVRRHFGIDLTLADFFRTGSLEELAAQVEAALVAQADPDQIDQLLDALEGAS